jgi:hypothetical protein
MVEDEGWLMRVEPQAHDPANNEFSTPAEFPLWASLGLRYVPRLKHARVNVELLAPYAHRNQPANLRRLTQSTLDNTVN